MGKAFYTLKDSAIEKVNVLSAQMGIKKSQFVGLAIDGFEEDLDKKILILRAEKDTLKAEVVMKEEKLNLLLNLKSREDALIESLESQKQTYMDNIKRKMDEGDIIGAIEIAKRVSRLLRCSYVSLLPQ